MAFSSMALAPSTQVLLSMTPTPSAITPTPSATRLLKPKPIPATATRLIKIKPTLTVTQLAGEMTVTPAKTRPTPLPSDLQAGSSDWIVAIGILIVAIIVVPIMLKHKEWYGR